MSGAVGSSGGDTSSSSPSLFSSPFPSPSLAFHAAIVAGCLPRVASLCHAGSVWALRSGAFGGAGGGGGEEKGGLASLFDFGGDDAETSTAGAAEVAGWRLRRRRPSFPTRTPSPTLLSLLGSAPAAAIRSNSASAAAHATPSAAAAEPAAPGRPDSRTTEVVCDFASASRVALSS